MVFINPCFNLLKKQLNKIRTGALYMGYSLKGKPVKIWRDPATVMGNGLTLCHWVFYLGRRKAVMIQSQEICLF